MSILLPIAILFNSLFSPNGFNRVEEFFTQTFSYMNKRAKADQYLGKKADSITASLNAVDRLNTANGFLCAECLVRIATVVLAADLCSFERSAAKTNDLARNGFLAEIGANIGLTTAKGFAPYFKLPKNNYFVSACAFPPNKVWNKNIIISFHNTYAGVRIKKDKKKYFNPYYWEYHNELVRPLL